MIFRLDKNYSQSLHSQICTQIRSAVLTGMLQGGEKLPPTRQMKEEYGISRNVWSEAYEQLIAEGFLKSRQGSGTFVTESLPVLPSEKRKTAVKVAHPRISGWKADFSIGTPNPRDFPLEKWGKALKNSVLSYTPKEMGYRLPGGLPSLKNALAVWLSREKGVTVEESQIFICGGSYQALMLAAQTLLNRRTDTEPQLIIENPSYTPIAEGAGERGFCIIPAKTDTKGIKPSGLDPIDGITAVCITPSHLFPRGEVYPIQRRLSLCRQAEEKDFYIIENDFEGDFRLKGSPVPPIFSLETDRVLYTGTFSQLLYPGIRMGYLVVPEFLTEETTRAITLLGFDVPMAVQKALTSILSDGTLSRHRRKMRSRYQKRQALFISGLKKVFGSSIRLYGTDTGLYLSCEFENILFDSMAVDIMRKAGIKADYEFRYFWPRGSRKNAPGLLLGYGGTDEENVSGNIGLLKLILEQIRLEQK